MSTQVSPFGLEPSDISLSNTRRVDCEGVTARESPKTLDCGTDSNLYNDHMVNRASKNGFMSAGELARASGVSTDTLRHYERKEVLPLPARSRNRYRQYLPEATDRVRMVRGALAIGFTLDELASILKIRDGGGAPCMRVRELAAAKLEDLELRIRETTALRDDLAALLSDWDVRLAGAGRGGRAGLLESLHGKHNLDNPYTNPARRLKQKKQRKEIKSEG